MRRDPESADVRGSALLGRRMVAEATGTFFLVLIGPGAVVIDALSGGAVTHVGIAIAFALVVFAMITTLGHLSGAHLNPAVTLAFWSIRRFPASEVGPYLAAQCAGAIAASSVTRLAFGQVGNLGATIPLVPHGVAFGVEWLLSLMLMLVIMAVATDERVARESGALVVGATVGVCALFGGPLTGASMNPARSLGPALLAAVWTGHWIYWLAPISAMMVAAWGYGWLRRAESPRLHSTRVPLGVEGPLDLGTGTTADAPTPSGSPIASASSRSSPRGG